MPSWVSCALGLALMVAYWPTWYGAATTPRWCVGVAIVAALFFSGRVRVTSVHVVGLALVAWLIVLVAWSDVPLDGVDPVIKLSLVVAAFGFGSSALDDVRPFVAGAAIGITLNSALALAQWFGWHGIESLSAPSGLFYNGNRLAEAAALVLACVLALRMWWALPGLIPALILPNARGAALATLVMMITWGWQQGKTLQKCATGLALALPAIMLAYMNLRTFTIDERVALWRDTWSGLTWPGHGLGSFTETFAQYAKHFDITKTYPEHPHNELLWVAYEGGAVAVVLFGALCVLLWRSADAAVRLALVVIGVESLFAMPLHDPATVLFVAVVAGRLAGAGGRVRDPVVAGGSPLRTRLAAGSAHAGHVRGT